MKSIPFKDRRFYYCFDCGWGEKGVHEYGISFDEAIEIMRKKCSDGFLVNWASDEDGSVEFSDNYYMLDQYWFVDSDWEGSQDY